MSANANNPERETTPTIAPTKPDTTPDQDPSKIKIPQPSVAPGPKAFYYFFPSEWWEKK